jgi:phytoene dehydrogenase-like protein
MARDPGRGPLRGDGAVHPVVGRVGRPRVPRGGSPATIGGMTERFTSLGGRLHLNTKVDTLHITNGGIEGVCRYPRGLRGRARRHAEPGAVDGQARAGDADVLANAARELPAHDDLPAQSALRRSRFRAPPGAPRWR